MQNLNMRNFFFILAVSLFLAACDTNNDSNPTPTPSDVIGCVVASKTDS